MKQIDIFKCINIVEGDRFDLVFLTSQRCYSILLGDTPRVDQKDDKVTMVALREIYEQKISAEEIRQQLISDN